MQKYHELSSPDVFAMDKIPAPHHLSPPLPQYISLAVPPASPEPIMADDVPKPYNEPSFRYKGPSDEWLAKQEGKKRNKTIVVISLMVLGAIVIAAIVVGAVVASNNNRKSKSSSSRPGSSSGPSSGSSNPSDFKKDSKLKRSFYGMAYTPEGALPPSCGASLQDVITDVQLMSQLTKKIRLYGAECNASALVLEAIRQTKVDMTVFLGVYNLPDDGHAAYKRQRDAIVAAIREYGTDHIEGITVGNEFMLNYLTERKVDDPNSAIGDAGAQILLQDIQDARQTLASLNLGKNIPVGNSDAGSYFNTQVLSAVDYGMANVHAWFAQVPIDQAAGWTSLFFDSNNVQPAALLPNNPKMYIAETGWPTKSSDTLHATNGQSAASLANLQIFLDTFVCQANANGTDYFYFEYFDEKWKDALYGGVEGWWGLFNADRTLKAVTIPDCVIP